MYKIRENEKIQLTGVFPIIQKTGYLSGNEGPLASSESPQFV